MASIGYNQGYYSRSKYNDLAHQAEATIAGVSGVSASGVIIKLGAGTIAGTSGFSSIGTQLDLGTATIQATSGFSSVGTQIDAGKVTMAGVSAILCYFLFV